VIARAAALATGLTLLAAYPPPLGGHERLAGADDTARVEALAAADEFLDRYLQPSGRIARTDEGGDTVSEGQAYGMLLAVALGDEDRLRLVWAWTDEHLQRDDGLLAWRWADGGIADHGAAADADMLAAAALALAGTRFGDADLVADARLINDAVLAHEVVALGPSQVLIAGPWADSSRTINASYLATPAMSLLWETLGDQRWGSVAAWSRLVLDALTAAPPHLPPDWATVDAAGSDPQAQPSPGGDSPRYGYDAARVIVQAAVDCRTAGQEVAARSWPFLGGEVDSGSLAATYTLGGQPLGTERHPLAYVAGAAAAAAGGEADRAAELLDAADAADAEAPSYFGAAWVALGRIWLDTDLLGGCRPGEPTRP
jgi:endoglucanase